MHEDVKITEKYVRNGWPSLQRPDLKPPEGWSLSLITSLNRVHNHSLSLDGKQVAFIWDRENLSDIYVMSTEGGWPRRITTNRVLVPFWNDEIPRWSADGRWLAFTLDGHVHIAPAKGGLPRKISDFAPEASSPVWMPDSQGLIVTVERQEVELLLLTDRDGAWPRPITNDSSGDAWDARPSPDGRWVAYVHRPFDDLNRLDVRLIDLQSGAVRTLAGEPKVYQNSPRWAPDSETIAFLSQRTGFYEIWLVNKEGENLRQLTHLGVDVADIAWSPDGSRLAFTVNRGGALELALAEVNSGEVTTLRGGLGIYARPSWSPRGEFLTVEYENPAQPPDLFRVEVMGGEATQLTFSNPPALACLNLVTPEQISFKSFDGLEIPAFLYQPARPNGSAIIYPHGGPSGQSMYEWDILVQYLVAKGYTYLVPNYRGSTGYGVQFEHLNHDDWGMGDTQDCLHGAKFLRALPGIQPERIAIMGGSYGGFLTICALSRDPEYLIACGVTKYGDADLVSSWAQCNRRLRLYTEIFLGHPSRNRQVYLDGSPIYQVENIKKPVLILHGLLDDIVPPEASEEFVQALLRAGKTFEYKTYADEPHGFLRRENQHDAWSRIERFLDWYLLPSGS